MVTTQHALLNLAMNEEVSRYVAHLEKKTLHLLLDNLRCRTILELLTDESWDDEIFPEDAEGLRKIATDAFVRRVGLSPDDAASLVRERWTTYNPEPVAAETASYLVGPQTVGRPAVVVSKAEQIAPEDVTSPGYDLEKHKRGIESAAANRKKG